MKRNANVFVLSLFSLTLYGQIYLISGTPSPELNRSYEASLFQLLDTGDLRLATNLVPQKVGVDWIGISYDLKRAVVLPRDRRVDVLIIDLEQAQVVKRCAVPDRAAGRLAGQWLADVPGIGPMFDWMVLGDDVGHPILGGIVLDASVSCANSFKVITSEHFRYLAAHGEVSVGDLVSWAFRVLSGLKA